MSRMRGNRRIFERRPFGESELELGSNQLNEKWQADRGADGLVRQLQFHFSFLLCVVLLC